MNVNGCVLTYVKRYVVNLVGQTTPYAMTRNNPRETSRLVKSTTVVYTPSATLAIFSGESPDIL